MPDPTLETDGEKPPVATIHITNNNNNNSRGRSPERQTKNNGLAHHPVDVDTISLAGSVVECNKEENLMDLMRQATAMCEQITLEKRLLVTKEKRMTRNLKSAQDHLFAIHKVNAQLMAENSDQKEELYQREGEINQLIANGKQAAKDMAALDSLHNKLQEQIEELAKAIETLTAEKAGLQKELEVVNITTADLQGELVAAGKDKEALKAQVTAVKEATDAVQKDVVSMQQEKDSVQLELKNVKKMLESANDEIDRLDDIQAEQQLKEAEARKAAMEARRLEFEAAEKEALASLLKAEELGKAKSAARKIRSIHAMQ
jgi:chromosome segregation ATPase